MNFSKGIGMASLVLLAGAWAMRPVPAAPPVPCRMERGVQPVVEQAPSWTEFAADEPSGRELLLRTTEEDLGLSPEEARAFRSAVLSAVADVDRAWEVREEGWAAVQSSAASDPELLGRLEGEIQFRYESEKDRALQRVAAHLGGNEQLRERLEEWFDAVR